MARKSPATFRGPDYVRAESDKFIAPAELGGKVDNFVWDREGSLRSAFGYLPYIANRAGGGPPVNGTWGRFHGIGHAKLANKRDILLMHVGNTIIEHHGWRTSGNQYYILVGPGTSVNYDGAGPMVTMSVVDDTRARFPTQFISTPSGIVILPPEGRPLFYDGNICAPLGFIETPSAPVGQGPYNARSDFLGDVSGGGKKDDDEISLVNVLGYAHDGNPDFFWTGGYWVTGGTPADMISEYVTQMHPDFGSGRVGTIALDQIAAESSNTGRIEMSAYSAAVQWVDLWGNLSAISERSSPVPIYAQSGRQNKAKGKDKKKEAEYMQNNPDLLLKQLLWTSIGPGPGGAIGRVLSRTKDMLHSGTQDLFEVPSGAGASQQFATIPDNTTTIYPDNVPDSWLLSRSLLTRAMPRARLGCLAFGRMFFANSVEEPGSVWWSAPGAYGTIPYEAIMLPDAQAREVTGMHPVPGGLLIFSERTTFLIRPGDDGKGGFVPKMLSPYLGCVAPNSIATLPDGSVIWMSRDGFATYSAPDWQNGVPPGVKRIGEEIDRYYEEVNRARWEQCCAAVDPESGEYRCWVPTKGKPNDLCFVFDVRAGFRRRTSTLTPTGVCVTNDHRRYMIACGEGWDGYYDPPTSIPDPVNGVWLLDHEVSWFQARASATFETNWIGAETSFGRISGLAVKIWLRSAQKSGVLTVEVMRDWRDGVIETETIPLYPTDIEDIAEWGVAKYDDDEKWLRRRPFWANADFSVPGAEVFRLRFTMTSAPGTWDFLGVMFDIRQKGAAAVRNIQ